MKKIIRLSESDLIKLVKKVLSEADGDGQQDSFPEYEGRDDIYVDSDIEKGEESDDQMIQQVAEYWDRKRNNKIRLNEDTTVEKIRSCYSNSNKPFPTSCEKGLHPVCRQNIRDTATSFFVNNKNAMNDTRISKFWNCINKIDVTILQGMG